jgi:hypothetical protein
LKKQQLILSYTKFNTYVIPLRPIDEKKFIENLACVGSSRGKRP